MQMHPWICHICWISTLYDVDVDIIGCHDWQLRPKWIRWLRVVVASSHSICHHLHSSILLSLATSIWSISASISPYYTILKEEKKKKKEPHHEKKNCCAGTWPWRWLLRSMSAACVLMRPSLNWNWGPVGSLVSLAHWCMASYAKLPPLAYRMYWRKPACNDRLLLDTGFDAMNTSLYPHCSHSYDTLSSVSSKEA